MARVGSIDGGVPVQQPAHARLAAPDSSAPVSEGDDKRDAAAVASALGMGDKGDFAPMWLALLPCDGVCPEKSPHPCALGCHPRAPAAGSSAMEKAHLPNSHRPNPSLQGFHYPTPPTAPLLSAGLPAHRRCVPGQAVYCGASPHRRHHRRVRNSATATPPRAAVCMGGLRPPRHACTVPPQQLACTDPD